MRKARRILALLAASLTAALACPALADNIIDVPDSGGDYAVKVHSFSEMRFKGVVRQKLDFSCGSASLATLLTYYYDMPVDEPSILDDMYRNGEKAKILKSGFSMLDMKNYLASVGLKAEGYREPLDTLAKVGIPAVVLINRKGYMHFVVVTGATHDRVMIADPALGMLVYNRPEFEKMWNKILFVVTNLQDTARQHFNSQQMWASRTHKFSPDAQLAQGISAAELSSVRTPNYYY